MASRLQEGSTASMGAITGAAGGAAIGSALGPPGSAAGAITGAVIGGGIGLTAGLADVFSAREAEEAIRRQQRQLKRALGDYEISSLELARGAAIGVGQQAEASAAKVNQAAAASGMDPAIAQQLAEQTRADVAAAGSQQIAQAVRAGADIEAARRQSVMQEAGFSQQLASAERNNVSDWVGQVAGLSAGAVDLAGSLGAISRDRAELNKTQEPSADLTQERDDQSKFVSSDNERDVNRATIYSGETREPPAMSTPGMPAPGAPAPGAPAPAPAPASVPRRPNTPAPAGGQPASPAPPRPAPAPQPAQGQRRQTGGERIYEPPYGIAPPPPPEMGIRPSGLGGFAANVSAGAYAPPQNEQQAAAVRDVEVAEQQLQAAVQRADSAYSEGESLQEDSRESPDEQVPGESPDAGVQEASPQEENIRLAAMVGPEVADLYASFVSGSGAEDLKRLLAADPNLASKLSKPQTYDQLISGGADPIVVADVIQRIDSDGSLSSADEVKEAFAELAAAHSTYEYRVPLEGKSYRLSGRPGFEDAAKEIGERRAKFLLSSQVVGKVDTYLVAREEFTASVIQSAPLIATAPSVYDARQSVLVFEDDVLRAGRAQRQAVIFERMTGLRVVRLSDYNPYLKGEE